LLTTVFFAANPHKLRRLFVSKNLDTNPEAERPIRNPKKFPVSDSYMYRVTPFRVINAMEKISHNYVRVQQKANPRSSQNLHRIKNLSFSNISCCYSAY
jgi:hypothetical protein